MRGLMLSPAPVRVPIGRCAGGGVSSMSGPRSGHPGRADSCRHLCAQGLPASVLGCVRLVSNFCLFLQCSVGGCVCVYTLACTSLNVSSVRVGSSGKDGAEKTQATLLLARAARTPRATRATWKLMRASSARAAQTKRRVAREVLDLAPGQRWHGGNIGEHKHRDNRNGEKGNHGESGEGSGGSVGVASNEDIQESECDKSSENGVVQPPVSNAPT